MLFDHVVDLGEMSLLHGTLEPCVNLDSLAQKRVQNRISRLDRMHPRGSYPDRGMDNRRPHRITGPRNTPAGFLRAAGLVLTEGPFSYALPRHL